MKNKLVILIGILGLMLPFKVNALNGSVSLTCDKNKVSPGSTISCSIKGNITEEVSSVHAEIDLGSNLTLENPKSSQIWEGNGEGGVYDLYTDENKSGTFDIGTFSVKVGDIKDGASTYIGLKNVVLSDASFNEQSFSVSKVNVRIASTINTLTGITVTDGTLNFDENTTMYELESNSDKVTINATKKDESSKVSGATGEQTLKYGLNVFKITVTSESGSTKDYTLNITRPDNRSKVNTLKSLKVSEGSIKFKENSLSYDINVANEVTSITIDAELKDEKSSFVEGYGPRTVELKEGKNAIQIKVKAENETVKTYTVNVTRKSNKSDNNYLSELKLSEGNIVFDKDEQEYKISVLYEVTKIDVEVKTEDEKATYEIDNPEELVVGENTITIKVKAETGNVREYKVIVVRKEEDQKLSNNNKLNNLIVEGYSINFNTNVYEYTLKIKDENSLEIEYVLDDDTSNVTIEGNENLKNGSVIRITVTAENGDTVVYKITVEKDLDLGFLVYIGIGIVVLLVIVVIVIIISKKKKNNSNNISNEENETGLNYVQDIPLKQENISNLTYTNTPNNNNLNNIDSQNNGVIQSNNVVNDMNVPNNNVVNNTNVQNNNINGISVQNDVNDKFF